MDDVEQGLVHPFDASRTRRPIFVEWCGLRDHIAEITELGIQWLNGSFATRKLDPNDLDLATFLNGSMIETLDEHRQAALNGLVGGGDTENFPRCDSFAIVEYPEDHPMRSAYVVTRDTFEELFFGRDVSGVQKGFVEVMP